jgi:FlaA1/EpsC-like NDP-sugar epimerase
MSLPQLNRSLWLIGSKVKRRSRFFIFPFWDGRSMKYVIAAFLSLREALLTRGLNRSIYRHGISIVPCVCALIIGFNAAAAIQLLSDVRILPVDIALCGSLILLLLIGRSKITLLVASTHNPHEIKVADLLEREVVPLETAEAYAVLKGQVILVTGAAGSIGSELCRQLLDYEPEVLIALDTNETGLFDLAEGLRSRSHPRIANLYPYIGDITDVQRMTRLFAEKRPNIVFHAAAYKHVPLLEQFPDLAIRTNTLATYYLCRLAQEYEVTRFVFISTDKAAEPVSIMGASKRLGELIVQSLAQSGRGITCFCAVRFGNVIGSRGSVVPVFAQQIEQGGPLTVTDPEATRYFMTIPEASGLVILTSATAEQGKLYLLDMGKPVRIIDLAEKMIRLCGLCVGQDIPIVYTGLRPGERLHEMLLAADEELAPTAHSRILCVTHKDNLPMFATIVHWIDTLEDSLQREDGMQHREHLFKIVREQKLIVTG